MANKGGPGRRMPWFKGPPSRTVTFSPSSLPNLELWVAADTSTFAKGATAFDGINGVMTTASTAALNPTNSTQGITIGGWFYIPAILALNSCIVAKFNSVGGYQYRLRQTGGAATINFQINFVGGSGHQTSIAYTVGAWNFICFSQSVSGTTSTITTCTNGTFGSVNATNAGYANNYYTAADALTFGQDPNSGTYAAFTADNFFMFNRALTQTEIGTIYNSGSGIGYPSVSSAITANIIGWWGMKNPTGNRTSVTGANAFAPSGGVTNAEGFVQGLPTEGETIIQMTDLSSNGRNATQTTVASRPLFVASAVNSKPALAFLTSRTTFFDLAYSFDHTNTDVWFIANVTNTGGGKGVIAGNIVTTGLRLIYDGVEKVALWKQVTNVATATTGATIGSYKLQEAYYNNSTGAYEFFASNTANGSGTSGVTGSFGSTTSFIGKCFSGVIDYMEGSICEIVVVSRQLSTAERLSLYNYAVAKYGGTI